LPAAGRRRTGAARQEPGRDEQQGDQGEQEPEAQMGGPWRVLRQRTAQQQSPCEAEGLGGGGDGRGPLRLLLGAEVHYRRRRSPGGQADADACQGAAGEQPQYVGRDGE
jgi:hypothetical protein